MHHKLNITPRIDNKAYSKVHRVFPSAISISIFTIIQFHWIYTRTVGKSLPFVRVGTYPTRNFATLDRHSYSRLYQWFRRAPNLKKKLYEKRSRLSTDTGQVSDLYIIITLSSPVFLINSRYPLFCAITHKQLNWQSPEETLSKPHSYTRNFLFDSVSVVSCAIVSFRFMFMLLCNKMWWNL